MTRECREMGLRLPVVVTRPGRCGDLGRNILPAFIETVINAAFAVLGIFLLIASRNPVAHRSLITFAAWSSLIHGFIMLLQAVHDPIERANLFGDVPRSSSSASC